MRTYQTAGNSFPSMFLRLGWPFLLRRRTLPGRGRTLPGRRCGPLLLPTTKLRLVLPLLLRAPFLHRRRRSRQRMRPSLLNRPLTPAILGLRLRAYPVLRRRVLATRGGKGAEALSRLGGASCLVGLIRPLGRHARPRRGLAQVSSSLGLPHGERLRRCSRCSARHHRPTHDRYRRFHRSRSSRSQHAGA